MIAQREKMNDRAATGPERKSYDNQFECSYSI